MNVTDLYYNFPEAAFFLFFVFAFLSLFWFLFQYRLNVLSRYTAEEKLKEVLIPQSHSNYWLKVAAFCFLWMALCLALMQPKGNARYPQGLVPQSKQKSVNTLRLQPHEVIFLIDASASMSVLDGRLGQSRFDNAKDIADQIMSRLRGQSGSLYAFTSDVTKLSPPSMDYLFMRLMLRNMTMNEGDISGTSLKNALKYIADNYLNPSTPLIKTLIIISDGEDNRLEELQDEEREKYIKDTVALLGEPSPEKLHVYTIGVGTPKGGEIPNITYQGKAVTSHLQEDLLKALSDKGQGRYYSGNDYAAVDIASDLAQQIAKADVLAPADLTSTGNSSEDLIYDLYYQFPLGLSIFLFVLYLLWPKTSVLNQNKLNLFPMWITLFLWVVGGQLVAVESHEEQLRLGEAYASAKDYSSAIHIYETLLQDDLSGWERSIVTYNLGTTLIAQGNYEKAIENLQTIPIDKDTSPVLASKVRSNLAVAYFRQGEMLSRLGQTLEMPSQDLFFKAIYYFKQTLEEISLAQIVNCGLFKGLGAPCPHDYNLEEMAALSKVEVAEMRKKARHHLIEHADLQQGLAWLSTGLQLIEQDILFMLENDLSASLQNAYQKLFSEHAASWNPLWEALLTKLSNEKTYASLFEKAKIDFIHMQNALQGSHFKEAQTYWMSASENLNQLLRLQFAENPLQEVVSKLYSDFSLASLQDPLETVTLLFLQKKLAEVALPKENETLQKGMDAIKINLEQSLAAIQKFHDVLGQIFFKESLQQLKRLLLLLDPSFSQNPAAILKAGIDEQLHALNQTRLLSRMQATTQAKAVQIAEPFVMASQEYPLTFADYFYRAAYAQQRKEFSAEIPEGQEDLRCQYHPWNEVFPLLQQGIDISSDTVKLLKSSPLELNAVMQNQEKVLVLWGDALSKLQEPKKSQSCHVTPLSKQAPQQRQLPEQSFEDISRIIQQMNVEDRRPVSPATKLKEGLRPW